MYHGALKFDDFYRRYCETLLGLDESIGRVLDAVEARNGGRDTVVIYMGDNGFSFGEHGLIDKRHMYEESMRIPMLAWAPGYIRSGSVIEKMAQNIDLAPTVLELAGVTPPAGLDGASLVPLMEGREVRWRQEVLYEYYWEWNYPQTPTVLGLRTDRYKYIHYHGIWDTDEFFDLVADPEEMRNLIREPGHRERVAAMRTRLFELLGETEGRQIPLREPRGERMDRQQ
jgi:arylsulfatase A-like enzyme